MKKQQKDLRIKKLLESVYPGKSILNIGCVQNQEIHSTLAESAKKIVGIDIDSDGIIKMKARGFDVLDMNAENIVLDHKFDYIIAGEVIEHLSNPGLFLSGITKILNDNGEIILTTPNISSVFIYLVTAFWGKTQDVTHVYYFDRTNLESLISRYDLKIKSLVFIPSTIKRLGDSIFPRHVFLMGTLLARFGFMFSKRLFGSYIFLVLVKK